MIERVPHDLEAYVARSTAPGCFICRMLAGEPDFEHEIIAQDDAHIAFLSRWPPLPGYALAAPKAHLEGVVRDFDDAGYLAMMAFVRRLALAVEAVLGPERTYLLSLGSQQGNSHVHWHVAGLPAGVPYREQQFHALMTEHGIVPTTRESQAALARELAAAMR